MAVAEEQEMRARAQQARALVIESEAEIPKAFAEALRTGKIGVMDYYRLQNIEADTQMRKSIGGELPPPQTGGQE
jgi:uncharacterized protein YqfA (UPF0365 family)